MSVNEEFLDEVLEQLQYGTTMSDNTEPMLTNNRNIAKQAILQHFQQEQEICEFCKEELCTYRWCNECANKLEQAHSNWDKWRGGK